MLTLYGPTLVIVLAVVEVMVLGVMVGRGREKYGVPAPATSPGSPSVRSSASWSRSLARRFGLTREPLLRIGAGTE